MSIPTAAFLDTSILDGQQYNFRSTALSTFVPACAKRSVKLLLPEPTEREIQRHIRERSRQAFNALEDARRKAPFLAHWRGLPQSIRSFDLEKWELERVADEEWSTFLKQFTVVKLGYETVDLKKVMGWYEATEAPFREGKKRKEFPDALAMAMLETYARKEDIYVAVVSADPDFKLACQRFNCLLYFQTLPKLTEILLPDDARVEQLQAAIDENLEVLTDAVFDELQAVSYYHSDDRVDVRGVDYEEIEAIDPSIVAIGDDECTIGFYASVIARVKQVFVETREHGPEAFDYSVTERIEMEGTAKLKFENRKLSSVTRLAFDAEKIRLRETPWGTSW